MSTVIMRLCALLMITSLLSPVQNAAADSTIVRVYAIAETQSEMQLIGISPHTNTSEILATWQKRRKARIDTLFPQDELNLLKLKNANLDQEWIIQTSVRALAVSPTGSQLAFALQQQVCLVRAYDDCFGMSEVILLNIATNQSRIAGTVSIRADAPHILIGCSVSLDRTSDNVIMDSLRWSPDEQVLIASMTTYWWNSCLESGNKPLVRFSAVATTKPIPLGTAIAFTISPNSATLVTFAKQCVRGECFGEFSWIDLSTNEVTEMAQHADLKDAYSTTSMLLVEGTSIIIEPYLLPDTSAGLNYAIAYDGQVTLLRTPVNPPIAMAMSVDSQNAYVQRQDGTLWRFSFSGDQVFLSPLYANPVEYWQVGQQNTLIVRETGKKGYAVINAEGFVILSGIDIESILQNAYPSMDDSLQVQSIGW